MKKTPLREFINEEIQLLEETGQQGLPKFRAVFQKCDEENRNGRWYSRGLWEKIVASPEIKKKLENRTMLGELNHPDYRDPNPENASHVVTKLWLSEDGKFVYGEAEILDTPKGRILEALLKAGVKIGVSSRGEGQVAERDGKKYVDEESYVLITFDSVLEPSVEESTASLVESKFGLAMTQMLSEGKLGQTEVAVLEQLTDSFEDSEIATAIKAQILEAKNKIETPNPKKENSLMENGQILDRLQTANEQLSETKEELARVQESSKNLKNKIASLKGDNANLKEKVKKLTEIAETVPALKEQLSEEKAKVDKAVAVIEGMKKAFDEQRDENVKVSGYYEKALKVLEGVTQKVNSDKVEAHLSEALEEVGGIDRFKTILGDVSTLTLDEAKAKTEEILALVEDGSIKKYPINTTKLKLREGKDSKKEGKKTTQIKEGAKSERDSMKAILAQL